MQICHTFLHLFVIQFCGWVRIYEFVFTKFRRVEFVWEFLLWEDRVYSL